MNKRTNKRLIKGSKNRRVQDFNQELNQVLNKSAGKMTDKFYEELEGLTF